MVGSLSGPTGTARFIKEIGAAAEIATLAEPVLESLGFRLVLVRIMGGQGPIVEIMAERPDGTMSIEDCKTVSMNVSALLDVHDPLPGKSYRLQVSSPGIDRPLVRASDFDQWAGYEAKIELKEMIDGRRRFRGVLEGFEDGEVRIEVELGEAGLNVLGIPLHMVAESRLVLTDDLVRESLRRAKKANSGRLEAEGSEAPGDSEIGDGAMLDSDQLEPIAPDGDAPARSGKTSNRPGGNALKLKAKQKQNSKARTKTTTKLKDRSGRPGQS